MPISRRNFLRSGAVASAGTAASVLAAKLPHGKKNVLFIAVDDQNTQLGCYGAPVKSPNLDALAARGTRFDRSYCQYPFCGPSRASLMTGLSPDTTHIYDLKHRVRDTMPDVVTIGQLFRQNGYYSARIGKIFHADVPGDIGRDGMDDSKTWDYVYDPQGVDHPQEEPKVTNFTPQRTRYRKSDGAVLLGSSISYYESPSPDRAMTDGIGADEMIRLLRENQNKPFYLALGMYRPHVPWIVPKKYFDMYPLESIKAQPPLSPGERSLAPAAAYTTHPPNYGMTELQQRKTIRAYHASTTFMDAQMGRVLHELKVLGLEKNTIVVFWADHGWCLGEHGEWEKQNLFEPAAHVPFIIAGAGKEGQVCKRITEHLDIYPTLVELCGLKGAPATLHGRSVSSLLQNAKAEWDKPAISQVTRPAIPAPDVFGYSLRNERYRYTAWQSTADERNLGEELYDYQADPRELTNLAHAPEVQLLKSRLRKQLAEITSTRGREVALNNEVTPASKSS
ncbi:MAG: sulfatase-like hydrolase/transferase [Acidobacteria bacterium]|nr:sulfatase-like hydrolase/transferase [Acidobacteriota bacterium]